MIALVTDYDVWHETEEPVTADIVVQRMVQNVETAKHVLKAAIPRIAEERECECAAALSVAIQTARDRIPAEVRERLDLLVGKYL
jgi:5'-methylthioadenosine phosphorylase